MIFTVRRYELQLNNVLKAVALSEAAAFFYAFGWGELHLILDFLYVHFGNVIGRLANILSIILLSSLTESRKVSFMP